MTIDEAILYMTLYKQRLEESLSDGLEEDIEAYDLCIDTMRKYQRIQAIVEAWKADVDIDSYDCMTDIYEVVEDE